MRKFLIALIVLAGAAQMAEAGVRDRLRSRRGAGCGQACAAPAFQVPVTGCAGGRCPTR